MRAMGYRGYGSHGQWGLWAMGTQGAMGYMGIGYIGNETTRGKVVQRVWVQGVRVTSAMGPMGNGDTVGNGVQGT